MCNLWESRTHALGRLAVCTNQKTCGDRIEQDEGLDVLTVEGTGRCRNAVQLIISVVLSKGKYTGAEERKQQRVPEIYHACLYLCFHVIYVSDSFKRLDRESKLGKFSV